MVLSALAALRRTTRATLLLLSMLMGALAGLIVVGLPEPRLAQELFGGLVLVFASVLVLPVAAGVISAERRGGYEQLVGLRPLSSLSWALGRLLGILLGASLLAVLLAASARAVGGRLTVPESVEGLASGLSQPIAVCRAMSCRSSSWSLRSSSPQPMA